MAETTLDFEGWTICKTDSWGQGPVLLQTPRQGYATTVACDRCRTPAACPVCSGPLGLAGALLYLQGGSRLDEYRNAVNSNGDELMNNGR